MADKLEQPQQTSPQGRQVRQRQARGAGVPPRARQPQQSAQMPFGLRMRRYVAAFVEELTERSAVPLDYSVASLRVVDFVVEGLRTAGRGREGVAETLNGLGAYVGEVMVRRAGAVWVQFDAEQRELFGQPVGVRMPDGRVWNPVGRVVNRFERGAEASLQMFFLTLSGRGVASASELDAGVGSAG